MMLSLVVELYDNNGKNFKTMRATVPGSTGYQIPVYNKSIVADNITNVIARLEPYEMYKTHGSYDLKLKILLIIKRQLNRYQRLLFFSLF